jgi:hypothetical protein
MDVFETHDVRFFTMVLFTVFRLFRPNKHSL